MAGGLLHDVSQELRGYHGRWAREAGAKADKAKAGRERMSKEAETVSEYRQTVMYGHGDVKKQLESIPMNGGKRINGVPTGRSKKGFYVAFPKAGGGRDSKSYKSSGHAARAVIEGRHHDETDPHEPEIPGGGGGFKEKLPAPKPEIKAPAPRPASRPVKPPEPKELWPPGVVVTPHPYNPKNHEVMVDGKGAGVIREQSGRFQVWQDTPEGPKLRGAYPSKQRAVRALVGIHKDQQARHERYGEEISPGIFMKERSYNPGTHDVTVDGRHAGKVVESGGAFDAWDASGKHQGSFPNKRRAAVRLVAVDAEKQSTPDERYRKQLAAEGKPPPDLPDLTDKSLFAKDKPQTRGPYTGKTPDITVKGQMTVGQKADARVQTMAAKSMTNKHNGELNAPVVITAQPHGHRASRSGTTFGAYGASKSSHYTTQLHLHSGMYTRSGAQANFRAQVDSGWWVPADDNIQMGQAVASHEYGHGVHDEMVRAGAMTLPRSRQNPYVLVTNDTEQQFWSQFADSLNVPRPQLSSGGMDVPRWFSKNNSEISKKVSRYGAKTPTEMMAELWGEYLNSSNPRPPAVVYGNYVRMMIGDKKGITA